MDTKAGGSGMSWGQLIAVLSLVVLIIGIFWTGMDRLESNLESSLGGRMDRLGGRMDRLGGRMDRLGGRMDRLESSLGGRMDRLDERLDGLSIEVAEIKSALRAKGIIASK